MIKKMRKRTLKLVKLEVLSRRLSPNHPNRKHVEADLAMMEAGFKGEKALDYFLELITDKEINVFHDLRLPITNTKHYFQIDTLIVTPFFLAVVEVKNIRGNIYFDHLADQIIRTLKGEQEAFQDPVNQAGRQAAHLEKLLEHKQFRKVPIKHLACFTNSISVITFSNKYPEKAKSKVIRPRNLLEKLEHFKSLYPQRILAKSDLKKISSLLLKNHSDNETDIL
ncbi:hypothetical protein CGZ90_18640, partial [Fictibacillus aquaticus]